MGATSGRAGAGDGDGAVDRLDGGEVTGGQRRIALTAAGGYFTDGYDLLVLSGALLAITPALSPAALGLLTAAAFGGMAVGSAVAGPLTDRFGRRPVFFADMLVFCVASLLILAVHAPWQLVVLRFVIGLAIGADMPASAAIIAEFVPFKRRGTYTAFGGVAWVIGGLVATGVNLLVFAAAGPEHWRWALASGAIPAAVLLVLRHKTPETPRWLAGRGREADAVASWQEAQGADADLTPAVLPSSRSAGAGRLARRPLVLLLVGLCVYWGINNMYGSGLLLYQPTLIKQLITPSPFAALLFSGAIALVSVVVGLVMCFGVIERRGRRTIAAVGTGTFAVAIAVMAFTLPVPAAALVAFAVANVFVNGCSSLAYYSWAPELFPTLSRGRAVGIVNMVGKLGSMVGTLTLPLVFASLGPVFFLLLAALAVVNLVVMLRLLPETAGRPLGELEASPVRVPVPAAGGRSGPTG